MKSHKFFALAFMVSLTACSGDVKETLGLKRDAPDEFAVERRPKLDLPPEFKLRPPVSDGSALRESSIRDELRADVFASDGNVGVGNAESILLQKTGAAEVDPAIRQVLNSEYGVEEPGFFERLESISDDSRTQTLVDAEKERDRIVESKKEGVPISEGEVETRSSTGSFSVLESILGE